MYSHSTRVSRHEKKSLEYNIDFMITWKLINKKTKHISIFTTERWAWSKKTLICLSLTYYYYHHYTYIARVADTRMPFYGWTEVTHNSIEFIPRFFLWRLRSRNSRLRCCLFFSSSRVNTSAAARLPYAIFIIHIPPRNVLP